MKKRKGQVRSIPAWAGEPKLKNILIGLAEVYPRVGGGTARNVPDHSNITGLSPRGRGNLL